MPISTMDNIRVVDRHSSVDLGRPGCCRLRQVDQGTPLCLPSGECIGCSNFCTLLAAVHVSFE